MLKEIIIFKRRWRKAGLLKKISLICFSMSLLVAVSVSAQKDTEVMLKYNKQNGLTRIVFEADEQLVNRAKITASASQIKIEFHETFHLKPEKTMPYEIVPSDKSLLINLPGESEVKFFRLSSPARLVFDIQKKETQTEKLTGKKEEKQIEKPAEKQPAKQPEILPENHKEKQSHQILSRVFVIDSGHGGYDFGVISGNANEKDITLNLAKDLNAALLKKGKKVFLMRKVDQYISLTERINFANLKGPDVFISLHSSLSKNFVLYSPKAEEQDVNETDDLYGLSPKQKKFIAKSKALADSIGKTIKDEFKVDPIRKEMHLPVLDSVGAPSVLIEIPSPQFIVYDSQMRGRVVNAVLNGLALYGQ